MKTRNLILGILFLVVLCSSTFYYFVYIDFSQKKIIKLNSWNLINESGCGNSMLLIDEHVKSDSFIPKTFWHPGHHDVCKDKILSEIIDFDTVASITNIYLYSNSWGLLKYSVSSKLDQLNPTTLRFGWNKVEINSKTKQLRLVIEENLKIGELVVEGEYPLGYQPKAVSVNFPTISEFLGVNAFVDDPIGASSIVNHVREYHESSWHQKDEFTFNFNPSFPGFDFETYYQNFNKIEKSVVPVIQHSGSWLTGQDKGEFIPVKLGDDYTNPNSYKNHATLLYEYSHNYKFKNSGLKYLENWNEPDKYWEGNRTYMPPYAYAAMSSMDWDGHQDTLKKSMKKGNPNCKLVMAGLIDIKSDYVNALNYWCNKNRGGNIPWTVVNAHLYSNDENAKTGISPEKFKLKEKVQEFVLNTKHTMPETKVWLTEYGYDKKPDSPQKVQEIAGYTPEQVQAIWLLRSTLLLSSTGLDRAYQYMLRDTKGTGLYTSSGLYGYKNNQITYFDSWYYLKNLVSTLGDYKFIKQIPTKEKDIYALVYQDKNGNKAYAIWAGAETRKTYENINIDLGLQNNKKIYEYNFEKTNIPDFQELLYSKTLKHKVTEKPFLIFEKKPQIKNHQKINNGEIFPENELSKTLIDEQNNDDPLFFDPKSEFNSLNNNQSNILKFKIPKYISYVCLFDDEGQSMLQVSKIKNGEKVVVYTGNLSLYKKWKTINIGDECEGIVIEHLGATSKIAEIIIYELK